MLLLAQYLAFTLTLCSPTVAITWSAEEWKAEEWK